MRKYKLLLVDDDPFILTGIGKDLENEGYEVVTAQSGEKAVALVEEQPFDLVITDLVMGGIDGIEVLRAAKTQTGETMVIILTGYGDMGSAIDALRLDADDYLLKPCEPEEMKFRVARCLRNRRPRAPVRHQRNRTGPSRRRIRTTHEDREAVDGRSVPCADAAFGGCSG